MSEGSTGQARHNAVQRTYYETRSRRENHRMLVQRTPYILNHVDHMQTYSGITPTDKVLDVGCGMGKYTIPLSQRGFALDGFDLSPKLLEELQAQAGPDSTIGTYCGDLHEPQPKLAGQYDHVIGFFMLHHLFDLQKAFTQMAAFLKPGGQVTFLEPNPWCALFYLQITFAPTMSWKAEKGMLKLTPGNLRRCLTGAGFQDVAIDRYGILPPFARNTSSGAGFEKIYDKIVPLRPLSAFQMIRARLA